MFYGIRESKQLLGSMQKGPAAFPSSQVPKWHWLTVVPWIETVQSAFTLQMRVEIHWVRNVTYLEGNGKAAEKSLPTHVCLVNYLPGLFCVAFKMPATAQWLEGFPVLWMLQSLGWFLALGGKCCKVPPKQKRPKNGGFRSCGFSCKGSKLAHLLLIGCFLRGSSHLD